MDKHLLVTISEDQEAQYGLRFACSFFRNKKRVRLTLLYIRPRSPEVWPEEKSHATLEAKRRRDEELEARGRAALEAGARLCRECGFPAENLERRLLERASDTFRDIAREGEVGLYDAVLLGKRGRRRLSEILQASLSQKLFRERFSFPLWICPRILPDRRGVLVCADGSDSSYRAADHVGYILNQESDHPVSIVQALPPDCGPDDERRARTVHKDCLKLIQENDCAAALPEPVLLNTAAPGASIMDLARITGAAAVALGRTGAGRSFLRRLLLGSVSRKIFEELDEAALWICP